MDNTFASRFLDRLHKTSQPSPFPRETDLSSQICHDCGILDFWAPDFHIVDTLAALKQRAAKVTACRFCKMRWDACKHLEGTETAVRFDRVDSLLWMNESHPPVFSLCRSLGEPKEVFLDTA